MEKKKKEIGFVESFLKEIPFLGDFFKKLGKIETFKEKFKEVDEKIEKGVREGKKKTWGFEANISVRPLMDKVKKETSEMYIGKDHFYGKKENKLILAVKVPQEEVGLQIEGKNLFIKADNFEKEVELPDYYKNIKKKEYKKGILVLELAK